MPRPLIAVAMLMLLAACSKPGVPDKDKPVEPKAAARHDDLARAIHPPIDRAQAAKVAAEAASKAQEAAIDAAGGVAPDQ